MPLSFLKALGFLEFGNKIIQCFGLISLVGPQKIRQQDKTIFNGDRTLRQKKDLSGGIRDLYHISRTGRPN